MHPASLEQLFVKFDPTKQTIVRKNESKPFTHTEKIKEVSA
ncbi:MAG: hypothetical protein Q8O99_00705 [bacterium]|nr:hypothetical protein [bacterium]